MNVVHHRVQAVLEGNNGAVYANMDKVHVTSPLDTYSETLSGPNTFIEEYYILDTGDAVALAGSTSVGDWSTDLYGGDSIAGFTLLSLNLTIVYNPIGGSGCGDIYASPTRAPTPAPTTSPTGSPSVSPTGTACSTVPGIDNVVYYDCANPTASGTFCSIGCGPGYAGPDRITQCLSGEWTPDTNDHCVLTVSPTASPTSVPSTSPTNNPTTSPTTSPTNNPTTPPTTPPSTSPTTSPSTSPSTTPTASPVYAPIHTPLPEPKKDDTSPIVALVVSAGAVVVGVVAGWMVLSCL